MKPQSIAVLIGAIVVGLLSAGTIHATVKFGDDRLITDVEPLFEYWLIFTSVFLLSLGIVGAVGAITDNKCVLSFFAFGNLFVLLACLVAGSLITRETVYMHGSVNEWCNAPIKSTEEITDSLTMRLQRCWNKMKEATLNCRSKQNAPGFYLQRQVAPHQWVDECPADVALDNAGVSYTERRLWKAFRQMQRRFECAGFCKDDIPLFSMTAEGGPAPSVPLKNCYREFDKHFLDAGEAVGYVFLVACLPLLISLIAAWWIVCAPPPRRIKGLLYDANEEIELEEQ